MFLRNHLHDVALRHAPDSLRHRRFGDAEALGNVLVGDPGIRLEDIDDVGVRAVERHVHEPCDPVGAER